MGRHTTKLGEASRAETRPPLPYPVRDGRTPASRRAAMERRARRLKSRLAALSAASVLAIGGVTGVSIALADEAEPSSSGEVVFSGGCGALHLVAPKSSPNTSQITVTEGSQVKYTNDLGTSAELHVGNQSYGIEAGSTQVFIMNRSAEVAMVPKCHGLFAQYDSAQVNVVEAPSSEEPNASGGQSDSDPFTAELPSRGSGDGSGGDSGSPSGGSDSGGDGSGAEGTSPHGGTPDAADEPESDATAEEERTDEKPREAEDEEMNSFGPMSDADGGAWDAEFDPAGEEVVAVDPKAVADGASGLLAMVAIVCLVGVSAAVMRTLLRQRATA